MILHILELDEIQEDGSIVKVKFVQGECSKHGKLDLGLVVRIGKTGLHCVLCGEHLGYVEDIPKELRRYYV